jgi:glycosyltransferase involved in cell wall biosynthesis
MKLLNVMDEMNPIFGGAAERTYQMSRYLGLAGVNIDLLTTKSRLDEEWVSNLSGGDSYFLNALHFRYLFPFGARKWLDKNIENYDAVHISKNWSLLASLAAAAAAKHKVPYVFSGMGFVAIHNRSKMLKRIYKKYLTIPMIQQASACIAVTAEEQEDLINAGADPKKVHLIPNGIIPENFLHKDDESFRRKYSLGNRKIMLFIGRMDPIKGVHLIIEAFGRVRENLDDWCLVLIGTQSAYRKEMERKTLEMGLKNSVIFLDPIFGEGKSEAYHAAEFIVVPSIKDAMTIVAPEAACCGKPVLITNTCDFSELAQCGGAVEVDPTVDGLSKGLELMAGDDCDRVEMGNSGFEYVTQNYKWESQAQKYLRLFEAVVSANKNER